MDLCKVKFTAKTKILNKNNLNLSTHHDPEVSLLRCYVEILVYSFSGLLRFAAICLRISISVSSGL